MHSDAIQQNWLMDVSYDNHVCKHAAAHAAAASHERDLRPRLRGMPQAYLRHAMLPDGRMNSLVVTSYLFGTRVRDCSCCALSTALALLFACSRIAALCAP